MEDFPHPDEGCDRNGSSPVSHVESKARGHCTNNMWINNFFRDLFRSRTCLDIAPPGLEHARRLDGISFSDDLRKNRYSIGSD